MNEVTVTIDRAQLHVLLDFMFDFHVDRPVGEMSHLLFSIVRDLEVRMQKRALEKRPTYRFKLKLHEALALRRVAIVGIQVSAILETQNQLRLVALAIDPLLPLAARP